jgi:endonuclease-8
MPNAQCSIAKTWPAGCQFLEHGLQIWALDLGIEHWALSLGIDRCLKGDTIHRAAATLQQALAGRSVTRFASVFPHLTRIDDTTPIAGRTIERVQARGKHLLIWFSGDLALRTHMRMHGSWHIYRPGERWQRPGHEMRIVIETEAFHAVGFSIPVAEFASAAGLAGIAASAHRTRSARGGLRCGEAFARLRANARRWTCDALLDQTAIAGIGNVYKSEVLFAGRVNPFTPVAQVSDERAAHADRLRPLASCARTSMAGSRRLRRRLTGEQRAADDRARRSSARLWVYGRAGKPCRRCGTAISRHKQGPTHARRTGAACQPLMCFEPVRAS